MRDTVSLMRVEPRPLIAWLSLSLVLGCGASSEVTFGIPAGDTSNGQGGTAAASTAGSGGSGGSGTTSSSSVATTTGSSGGATTSATTTVASSSAAGGGSNCAHDFCKVGASLSAACDACVTKVCAADAFCCQNTWDAVCVYEVELVCNVACPGDPGTPGCAALYGGTPGFQLCTESASACSFAINTKQGSCGSRCAAAGGECVAMVNDNNNVKCSKSNEALDPNSCGSTQYESAICICSRGCGGGLPCSGGKTCSGGSCK